MKTQPFHLLALAQPAPAATGTLGPDDRSSTFRPVQGGNEIRSGEQLLVMAYAAIWIILFAMILLSWRRQQKTDERVATLEGALAKARAGSKTSGGDD